MHIKVRFDGLTSRRWHLRLLQRLALREGCLATIDDRPRRGASTRDAARLLAIEGSVHGVSRPGAATAVAPAALDPFRLVSSPPVDLVLDLCGDVIDGDAPVWRLDVAGVPGERGIAAALLAGRAPIVTIRRLGGSIIATGRLGTDAAGTFGAFEDCLTRTITLILAALDGAATKVLPDIEDADVSGAPERRLSAAHLLRHTAALLAKTAARRFHARWFHTPHWRVGWRKTMGPDLLDLRSHPASGWIDLPDDGSRFYADPFPIERDGKVTLFVEDFVHARNKGVISAVTFGPDGPLGRPEPVLDLPYHLSYPFVFERGGSVWMIPESCAAGTIDLYRATDFPRGWIREATLVDNVLASDATLHQWNGRWWMFATVRDEGGAYSDTLHLWTAPDFRGPWTPHPRNPVLIDIASARPAGRIVERDGMLLRPVQDCRAGYGTALGIARISQLDDSGFAQTVETVLRAGAGWPGRRLHTFNSAGGFEFIDGSAIVRKRLPALLQRGEAGDSVFRPRSI